MKTITSRLKAITGRIDKIRPSLMMSASVISIIDCAFSCFVVMKSRFKLIIVTIMDIYVASDIEIFVTVDNP
jgi:hypothetical protein